MNPIEIEQVFVNVLRNALASVESKVHVEVLCAVDDGRVAVIIRDNGAGISADDLPRLFDPFFTTRLHAGGTGLGLSVAHGILNAQNGSIQAESEPGQGTTIRIEMPINGSPLPA